MSFYDDLRPASFRGVAFSATDSSLTVGRRTKVFEYPQRDKPFVEDLGKSARTITLTAVFAGPDYIAGMAKLLEAMEAEGSGVLVHPMLGSMTVTPTAATKISYSANDLGLSTAQLEFTESGDYVFPSTATDTSLAVSTAAGALKDASASAFAENFSLSGLQDYVIESVKENLQAIFDEDDYADLARLFGASKEMSSLSDDAVALISGDIDALASTVRKATGFSEIASGVSDWRRVAMRLSRFAESAGLNRSFDSVTGAEQSSITSNSLAVQALVRQSILAEVVASTAEVGGDEDTAQGGIAYDDMIAIRDEALDAIDAEMLVCESDEIYDALEQARAAVYEDMTERAQDEARLIEITPPEVQPALVIAYDLYEDAGRDQEIIDRNKIRHGGFVSATALSVLSR